MKKYLCTVCGHFYDEDAGDEKNHIAKQTAFESLPEKWVCPVCGAFRSQFRELNMPNSGAKPEHLSVSSLSALKGSAICSNLAKGCEKQNKADEASIYHSLAKELKSSVTPAGSASFSDLKKRVEHDISSLIPMTKRSQKTITTEELFVL